MGVHIDIGRSGSGKSLLCFRAIVDLIKDDPLGPAIYWIVPKQETFTAERELTCNSGLNGFCRARIVSFELLGEEILAECGGTAIPQITQLGRQMIIGHLLRKNEKLLSYYGSAARQVGLAAELDATFAEMERRGKSVTDLTGLIHELETAAAAPSLAAKLGDLRLLYEQYVAYLGQERLDPHRRLTQVLESLHGCQRIRGATIFVDGFLEFTDHERKMLAGLAKVCDEMHITLLLDPASPVVKNVHLQPNELSLFHRTEDTFKRLWFAFSEVEIVPHVQSLKSISRFQTASLRQIEQHLFAPRPVICKSVENIRLIETPDRRAEVDAAAREVRRLIDSGLRLREIAVLMRNLDDYHELIDASFREHDIEYFVDRRRTAAHHPLLQFTRAVLQVAMHHWPREAVMTLLKTELAGLSRDEVDELENYVLLHRIREGAWTDPKPWAFRRKLTRGREDEPLEAEQADLARIDAMRRRVVDRIAPLATMLAGTSPVSLRSIVVELFNTFERFDIRRTLGKWMEADETPRPEERAEHEQVWGELVELLDQLVDVFGDQQVTPANFVEILETGLERFDLALTPQTMDQLIVGSVDRTRSLRPRAVILLGMNDSQLPRSPQESSILSDRERQTLAEHRVELDPDGQRTLLDEHLLGYIAMTRASEHLCLIRAIADEESRPQSPSVFWMRLREQFPILQVAQIPRESRNVLDCIGTPRQLVTALMHWVRHGTQENQDTWKSLYSWLATHECCNDAIDTMRYRAWRALRYANDAKLSDQTIQRLFKSPLSASVSQIETFAACPFKHFIRYGLKLTEREDEDVTAIDLGNACHGILEQIVRQMLPTHAPWDAENKALVSTLAKQVGQELRGELMLGSARNQYILQRIERTIGQVIAAQAAAAQRGRMRPWRAELEFGKNRDVPALVLKTPLENIVELRGKIDRVDIAEKDASFAVFDYKYRGDSLSLDWIYHGLSLQLLTYLLVLQQSGFDGKQLTPAAAFYVQLLRQLERVKHPDQATAPDDPLFHLKVKPRGIVDWGRRLIIDSQHTAKGSDVASLYVKNDGGLGNKNNTDACETEEFQAMLRIVERKLAELADRIIAGQITVAPYRIANTSPCPQCEYRSVCRFDVALNHYVHLTSMKREDVLKRAVEETQ